MEKTFEKDKLMHEICDFLSEKLTDFSQEHHLDTSFSRLGLDSVNHVQLTAIVENHLQRDIDPTLAFDYPTINSMLNYLESNSQQ